MFRKLCANKLSQTRLLNYPTATYINSIKYPITNRPKWKNPSIEPAKKTYTKPIYLQQIHPKENLIRVRHKSSCETPSYAIFTATKRVST